MTAGAMPPGLSPLPTLFETPFYLSAPATPAGIFTTSPSVALYHSSVIIAGTSMGKQLGALTAPPQSPWAKAKKSMGWSHQMLKLSRLSKFIAW
jgi:hypothetical protein